MTPIFKELYLPWIVVLLLGGIVSGAVIEAEQGHAGAIAAAVNAKRNREEAVEAAREARRERLNLPTERALWVTEPCVEAPLTGTPGPETCLGKLRAMTEFQAADAKIVPNASGYLPRAFSGYVRTSYQIYYRKAVAQ